MSRINRIFRIAVHFVFAIAEIQLFADPNCFILPGKIQLSDTLAMQKLWLKDFEFHINPATAQAAQQLVQAGAVRSLREVEKHFWVALVDDPETPREVETIITPHKIKAFTCECWAAGRRLMCPHVAATLLKLRQFLEQKAEERRARAEARATTDTGRLTVQHVLDEATPEALLDFVRDYARRDRDFALALKTQFAATLDGPANPFLLVLDAAIPRGLGAGAGAREADFRRLRKTLDELEIQLQTAAAGQNFRTVFQVASAILEKIGPLLTKNYEQKRAQLVHYCRESFSRLTSLPADQLSPELRSAVWDALFALAEKNLVPAELERDFARFLTDSGATDDGRFERLRALFDRTPAPAPAIVLLLFVAALAQRHRPEAVVRVLDDYTDRPAAVKMAIVELYYLRHWKAAAAAAEHFLEKTPFSPAERRELEDVLLFIAEKTADRPRLHRLLRDRFLRTSQFDFFNRLKISAAADWPAERQLLLDALRDRSDAPKLAAVLAAEGEREALALLLAESDDLTFLQRYEDLFLPDGRDFVQARYVAILANHLAEHFGLPAAVFVREALGGLLRKGETPLVVEIIRSLTAAFPERHTLPAELTELFPKTRRKSVLQP